MRRAGACSLGAAAGTGGVTEALLSRDQDSAFQRAGPALPSSSHLGASTESQGKDFTTGESHRREKVIQSQANVKIIKILYQNNKDFSWILVNNCFRTSTRNAAAALHPLPVPPSDDPTVIALPHPEVSSQPLLRCLPAALPALPLTGIPLS